MIYKNERKSDRWQYSATLWVRLSHHGKHLMSSSKSVDVHLSNFLLVPFSFRLNRQNNFGEMRENFYVVANERKKTNTQRRSIPTNNTHITRIEEYTKKGSYSLDLLLDVCIVLVVCVYIYSKTVNCSGY